jgi:hypothetical protein
MVDVNVPGGIASFGTGDQGDEIRQVPLNINQILFITAGLKDLAQVSSDKAVIEDNLALVQYLEGLI